MSDSCQVSVVICAKGEARSLGPIVKMAQEYAEQVVVVIGKAHDSDETQAIATELKAQWLEDQGVGKGLALQQGLAACHHPHVVFLDADGSHDPHDIPKLLAPLRRQEADLVIGSRIRGGSDELGGNLSNSLRLIGNTIITWGINWRFGQELTDSQNGFRAAVRDKLLAVDLCESSTTIEQEILIKMLKKNNRVCEVPTHEYARTFGHSHISLKRAWPRYLYSWLKLLLTP